MDTQIDRQTDRLNRLADRQRGGRRVGGREGAKDATLVLSLDGCVVVGWSAIDGVLPSAYG